MLFDDLRSLISRGLTHDTKTKPPTIITRVKGEIVKTADRFGFIDKFDYDRNISLFMEPIPLDIAKIYQNRHRFWKSGLELYQYEVPLENLPVEIVFRLVESPEKNELVYRKQNWDLVKDSNDPLIEQYRTEILKLEERLGYRGHGRGNLSKAARKFQKGIKGYMNEAIKLAYEFDDNLEETVFSRYAQCVPHLMIYPGYKEINYSNVTKIKLK